MPLPTEIDDLELQWLANRGFTTGTLEDRRRAFYLATLPPAPLINPYLTDTDLEVKWLKTLSASTSSNSDDLYDAWLQPIYGPGKAVQDLKYALYLAG